MSLLFNMLSRFVIAFLPKLFLRVQTFTLVFRVKVLLCDATSTTFCDSGYAWFDSFFPWIQWAKCLSILEMEVPFSHPISEKPSPPSCFSFSSHNFPVSSYTAHSMFWVTVYVFAGLSCSWLMSRKEEGHTEIRQEMVKQRLIWGK